MTKKHETVSDIMAEIKEYCRDVLSRKINKESSFFASIGEAARLQEACIYGDYEDALRQLRTCKGEQNAEEYVERLEAALNRDSTAVESVKSENAEPLASGVGGHDSDDSDDNDADGENDDVVTEKEQIPLPPPKPQVGGLVVPPVARPKARPSAPAQKQKSPPKPSVKPQKLKQLKKKKNVPPDKPSNPSQTIAPTNTKPVAAKPPEALAAPLTEKEPGTASCPGNEPTSAAKTVRCRQVRMMMLPRSMIRKNPVACKVFRVDPKKKELVKSRMREIGFDPGFPALVVEMPDGTYQLCDGHTRLECAEELDIVDIPVIVVEYDSELEMLRAMVVAQVFRRECSDAVILAAVEILLPIEEAKAKERQGKRNDIKTTSASAETEVQPPTSCSLAIAHLVGRSKSMVDRLKSISKDPAMKERVLNEELSISEAYRQLTSADKHAEKKKDGKPSRESVQPEKNASEHVEQEVLYVLPAATLEFLVKHLPEDHIEGFRKLLEECGLRERNFIETCLESKCGRPLESLSTSTGSSSSPEAGSTATSEENAASNTRPLQPSFF